MWFSLLSYPVLHETHSPHHPSFCNYCGNKKDNPVQTEFSGLVLNSLHTPAKMSTPGPQWFQTPALNQNGSQGFRKKKKKKMLATMSEIWFSWLGVRLLPLLFFVLEFLKSFSFFRPFFSFFLPSFLPSFLFCFLGSHLQHMEVPRLGVKLEL